jgi:protein TilB
LIRKSAEHNNGEVSTLEELSLHQRNLIKIDCIDNECRKLKILYLQNNLIPKIEHVTRCKELNYLNMALNNVQLIEGLDGCEMLEKLDLTVNFIGDLRSVCALQKNRCLETLYLTGNPCSLFDGYREYVVAKLPQLKCLDGQEISRSERIVAMQGIEAVEIEVNKQSVKHIEEQAAKKAKVEARKAREAKMGGTSSWYCDTQTTGRKEPPKVVEIDSDASESDLDDEEAQEFWASESDFTPESRVEAAQMAERQQRQKDKGKEGPKKKKRNLKKVNYFHKDGRPYNMNEGGWDFRLDGQGMDDEPYKLEVACYKHLDTSAIDLDVQPTYIRIIIKEKIFQLYLPEEVNTDNSKAERSKVTGRLMVTMQKVNQLITAPKVEKLVHAPGGEEKKKKRGEPERLEVGEGVTKGVDVTSIISDAAKAKASGGLLTIRSNRGKVPVRANDDDFVDDDDVPPLE